jgi:PBSX family phage portal protein
VTNTVGLGYRFVPLAENVRGANRGNLALLEHLFGNCNPDQTFTEVLSAVQTDVECLGNGYLELTRNSRGEIDGFYHVPGTTMRVRGGGGGFLQIRETERRYFRPLGGPEEADPLTGEPQNEIMHLKKYTPQSSYYGIPDIVAAMAAIVGDKEAREYNIDFFENHAVPRLAIIVEGGQLSDDVLAQIQEYMETEIRGQGHKTLVLDVPGNDVRIRLEPLTVGVSQDAAFLEYRKANRDEVLMVHRVPPSKITVVEHANLANSKDQDKTFREQVIRPEQRRIEYRLNRMIREQMGIGDWRFRFEEMDLSEAREEAEIARIYSEIGAWTVEEIRGRQGLSAAAEQQQDGG